MPLVLMLFAVTWTSVSIADESPPKCIVPSAVAGSAPSIGQVAGHYSDVSESEWSLELLLEPDGTAAILSEAWLTGEYDRRSTVRHSGTWSLKAAFVELRYAGRCETLLFNPALSFAEFGPQGAAAGLQGQHSSVSHNLFIGRSLWLTKALRKIPEVE